MAEKLREEDKQMLEEEKVSLEEKLDEINNRPSDFIQRQKDGIDRSLKLVKKKTTPVHEGNKTMYQHLKWLRDEWAKEKREGGFVDNERKKTKERLEKVKKQLE